MAVDGFNYEEMVQDHLRNVVRDALNTTAEKGLPGAHHFYISFKTDYPGVQLAEYLKERHPEEMTIVIQHQYWGLEVEEKGFSITLSFSDSQERIYIPFYALLSFMDPYAKFGLQFTPPSFIECAGEHLVDSNSLSGIENTNNVVTLDNFRKK